MALVVDDFYLILSDGMYAGTVAETTITDTQRYSRILSHGLLSLFAGVAAVSDNAVILRDVVLEAVELVAVALKKCLDF